MRKVLIRDPVATTTLANGTNVLTFSNVTDEEFDKFSVYLSEAGCGLVNYSVNDTAMQAVIEKEGHTFEFSYDYALQKATLNYPKDTMEEKFDVAAAIAEEEARIKLLTSVGSYVTFGHYPQTREGTDNTPIEWLILDAQDGKALLISRYALDSQKYNSSRGDITWQKCNLRTWLNETFINKAFTSSEQKGILITNVDNSKSQGYSVYTTIGGNNTQDKVFLLSAYEVQKYFMDYDARKCAPTSYALRQLGLPGSDSRSVTAKQSWKWWLRSPGDHQNRAAYIGTDGKGYCNYVDDSKNLVRPAIWVDISAIDVSSGQVKPAASVTTSTTASGSNNTSAGYNAGQYLTFGHYPQTKNGNDNTPIEWLVLAQDGNQALLISRYALDCQSYNDTHTGVTWQECSLRTWLNEMFINEAFTNTEQEKILTSYLENSERNENDSWISLDGNDTSDKVFLLSKSEAQRYFKADNARMCVPTEYSIAQGASTTSKIKVDNKGTCWWWLRTPGGTQDTVMHVTTEGSYDRDLVDSTYYAVRPAIWVDISTIDVNGGQVKTVASVVTSTTAPSSNSTSAKYKAGQYLTFGHYPQTKNGNDNTSIEWLVLEVKDGKALLISRYGLDGKLYHNEIVSAMTWEKCELRTWLNDTFKNKAFTKEEQKAILLTNVDNSKKQGYPSWNGVGGNNTQDRIFLLSYAEANKYFGVDYNVESMKARTAPTAYAANNGAEPDSKMKTSDGKATCAWWLRSPGDHQELAGYIGDDGSLEYMGFVFMSGIAVRPAMWVDLESGVF